MNLVGRPFIRMPSPPTVRVLLPGCSAWLTTVGLPIWDTRQPLPAAFAVFAISALCLGLSQWRNRPRLARWVGIFGFLGFCLAAWAVSGSGAERALVQPIRSAVGAVSWGLFAIGWGGLSVEVIVDAEPSAVESRASLTPRRKMPRVFWAGIAVVALGAMTVPAAAWWIESPVDALLGHGLAGAAAIAIVGVGLRVVTESRLPQGRAARWGSLLALLLWSAVGLWLANYGNAGASTG